MNKIIVANLKMYQLPDQLETYFEQLNDIKENNIIFCPTSILIPYYLEKGFKVGIQNIYHKETGPYTGEVSPVQAKQLGITYVILGHNERKLFGEKSHHIHQKLLASLKQNLNVILCIGETLKETENKKTVLKKQLISAFQNVPKEDFQKVLIAYEPIWAIGTGLIPDESELEETLQLIQYLVTEITGEHLKILYGGSVDETNISKLVPLNSLNGFLVGSASANPMKLKRIIEVTFKR